LRDATVGIVGMGRLGSAVAALLQPFGVAQGLYVDQHDVEGAEGWERVDLDELMASSSVVLALLPLTTSTHHLIGAEALAQLRPASYLVNVGRGSVVDELAVLAALDHGRLAGYAADVFEMEDWSRPTRPDRIPTGLREHPRTVFTPHLGSAVGAVRREMSLAAAEQVFQALHGRRPDHAVNDLAS
jgi:phosphonate dehydrogenase